MTAAPEPSSQPYPSQPTPPARPLKSGFAVTALVASLLGMAASFAGAHGAAVFLGSLAVAAAVAALVAISRGAGTSRGMAVWGLVLGIFGALAGLGGVSGQHTGTASSGASGTLSTATAPAADRVAELPPNTFTDGIYEVGTAPGQIAPGRYHSDGVSTLNACSWSRLKNNDGASDDIIAISIQGGPQYLTVKPTDGYVKLSWGCTWTMR